jgi:hypothetical protein
MAILSAITIAISALAACYSPVVRDCTVTCATPSDCTGGQICDSDGFCAMPEAANRCGDVVRPDASVMTDARPLDARLSDAAAPPAPDATLLVELAIEIGGRGKVHVIGVGLCNALFDEPSCTYTVLANIPLQLHAIASPGWRFEKWSNACGGRDELCVVTPTPAITKVKAKFTHDDNDDDDDDDDDDDAIK